MSSSVATVVDLKVPQNGDRGPQKSSWLGHQVDCLKDATLGVMKVAAASFSLGVTSQLAYYHFFGGHSMSAIFSHLPYSQWISLSTGLGGFAVSSWLYNYARTPRYVPEVEPLEVEPVAPPRKEPLEFSIPRPYHLGSKSSTSSFSSQALKIDNEWHVLSALRECPFKVPCQDGKVRKFKNVVAATLAQGYLSELSNEADLLTKMTAVQALEFAKNNPPAPCWYANFVGVESEENEKNEIVLSHFMVPGLNTCDVALFHVLCAYLYQHKDTLDALKQTQETPLAHECIGVVKSSESMGKQGGAKWGGSFSTQTVVEPNHSFAKINDILQYIRDAFLDQERGIPLLSNLVNPKKDLILISTQSKSKFKSESKSKSKSNVAVRAGYVVGAALVSGLVSRYFMEKPYVGAIIFCEF